MPDDCRLRTARPFLVVTKVTANVRLGQCRDSQCLGSLSFGIRGDDSWQRWQFLSTLRNDDLADNGSILLPFLRLRGTFLDPPADISLATASVCSIADWCGSPTLY